MNNQTPERKTDIAAIDYTERYKTDDDGYRWVMLEEAKKQYTILEQQIEQLQAELDSIKAEKNALPISEFVDDLYDRPPIYTTRGQPPNNGWSLRRKGVIIWEGVDQNG